MATSITKDLMSDLYIKQLLAPTLFQTAGTAETTTYLDMQGYESAVMELSVGAEGDTLGSTVKFTLEMLESSDHVTWTDCQHAILNGTLTALTSGVAVTVDANGEAPAVYPVGVVATQRYVKAKINVVGTHTNGTVIGVNVIAKALTRPVTSNS